WEPPKIPGGPRTGGVALPAIFPASIREDRVLAGQPLATAEWRERSGPARVLPFRRGRPPVGAVVDFFLAHLGQAIAEPEGLVPRHRFHGVIGPAAVMP